MVTHIHSLFNISQPSPLERVNVSWTKFNDANNKACEVELWCKRDDLLHPVISGNKWRKLAKPLQQFTQNTPAHVLSFGGAYSNHLHALAYCCNKLNIKFTAVVRGAYLRKQTLNSTLQDLQAWNATLHFVDKQTYQRRNQIDYLTELREHLSVDVVIPEGGSQPDALFGMQDMVDELKTQGKEEPFDTIILPVGSGASMAGLLEASGRINAKNIIGVAVLKGEGYLESLVSQFLHSTPGRSPYLPWHIEHNYHHGGYAKSSAELDAFCQSFNHQQSSHPALRNKDTPLFNKSYQMGAELTHNKRTHLLIEPVYSGKCFYAIKSLIQKGYFAPKSRILVVHTGGLQSARLDSNI